MCKTQQFRTMQFFYITFVPFPTGINGSLENLLNLRLPPWSGCTAAEGAGGVGTLAIPSAPLAKTPAVCLLCSVSNGTF